ncbi:type III secretion system outer membrane ring subunit SctC [Thiolapillus sp.]
MKKNKNSFFAIAKLAAGLLLLVSLSVQAGDPPNFDKSVNLVAREQPLASFLGDLFGQIGMPTIVDAQVEGKVNGNFTGVAVRQVFNDIARSFGLVMFYDGAVVFIYTGKDVSRRILAVPDHITRRVMKNATDLRLIDEQNRLRASRDGGLVVTGTKRFLELIEEMVYAAQSNLQSYEPPFSFRVFYLKYAWAQDVVLRFGGRQVVVPGVASTLRRLVSDTSSAAAHSVYRETLISPSLPGMRGQGLASIGKEGRLGLPDSNAEARNDARSSPDTPHSGTPDSFGQIYYSQSTKSQVRIEADPRLNAIIVRDAPNRISRYKELIKALDVEPQMLEIEATIIDIYQDRMLELGINWRWMNGDDEVLFGTGDGSDLLLRPGRPVTPMGRGGFVSFVLGDKAKFIGRINALEAKGAARIVTSPHVLTLSNVEAIFDTSSTFFVRVEGNYEVDLYNISVGTSLRVTPHVFKDDGETRIKLLITVEDGKQRDQTVDRIPVIETSSINTQALIGSKDSILIGGLVREVSSDSEDKVPFVGDLPLLGNLFKTNKRSGERVERLFLISPRLVPRNQHLASYPSATDAALGRFRSGGMEREGKTLIDRLEQKQIREWSKAPVPLPAKQPEETYMEGRGAGKSFQHWERENIEL